MNKLKEYLDILGFIFGVAFLLWIIINIFWDIKKRKDKRIFKNKEWLAEYRERQEMAIKETRSFEKRPRDWRLRQKYILRRDNYRCQICGGKTMLHVHHKKAVNESPDHSGNNLVTLCIYCHSKQPGKGHGDLLIERAIIQQCKQYKYEKETSTGEYDCSFCEEIIHEGTPCFVNYYQINCSGEVTIRRICEKCLLGNPSGYRKKINKNAEFIKSPRKFQQILLKIKNFLSFTIFST